MALVSAALHPEALQITAFSAGKEIRPQQVLRRVLREWGDTYDGEPISLPGSENFPPDVPSVILTSNDGRHRLEVARSRINAYRLRVDEEPLPPSTGGEDLVIELFGVLNEEDARIGRFGAILTSVADIEQPASEVAQHFLQARWLPASGDLLKDLQMHMHLVYDLADGLPINHWLRVRTAKRLPDLTSVAVVEQDLNSLEEERQERQFTADGARDFVIQAARRFEWGLNRYFPSNTG